MANLGAGPVGLPPRGGLPPRRGLRPRIPPRAAPRAQRRDRVRRRASLRDSPDPRRERHLDLGDFRRLLRRLPLRLPPRLPEVAGSGGGRAPLARRPSLPPRTLGQGDGALPPPALSRPRRGLPRPVRAGDPARAVPPAGALPPLPPRLRRLSRTARPRVRRLARGSRPPADPPLPRGSRPLEILDAPVRAVRGLPREAGGPSRAERLRRPPAGPGTDGSPRPRSDCGRSRLRVRPDPRAAGRARGPRGGALVRGLDPSRRRAPGVDRAVPPLGALRLRPLPRLLPGGRRPRREGPRPSPFPGAPAGDRRRLPRRGERLPRLADDPPEPGLPRRARILRGGAGGLPRLGDGALEPRSRLLERGEGSTGSEARGGTLGGGARRVRGGPRRRRLALARLRRGLDAGESRPGLDLPRRGLPRGRRADLPEDPRVAATARGRERGGPLRARSLRPRPEGLPRRGGGVRDRDPVEPAGRERAVQPGGRLPGAGRPAEGGSGVLRDASALGAPLRRRDAPRPGPLPPERPSRLRAVVRARPGDRSEPPRRAPRPRRARLQPPGGVGDEASARLAGGPIRGSGRGSQEARVPRRRGSGDGPGGALDRPRRL